MKLNLLLVALLASAEAGKGKIKGEGGRGGRKKRGKPAKKPRTTTTTTLGTAAADVVTSSTAAAVAERGKKKGGGGRGRGKRRGPEVAPIIERSVAPPGDEVQDVSFKMRYGQGEEEGG